jgi:hypothetical protein
MNFPTEPVIPAAIVRRNRNLGLALGVFVILVTVSFIVIFTQKGLPKDADIYRRLHREGRVGHPLGETIESSTVPVMPAEPTSQETIR